MPSSRHHAEWLSLVEVSGPFLTMPVLERVFPQGLDAHDPDHIRLLRVAFDEWEDDRDRPAIHRAWIDFVLRETLGLPGEVLAEGQSIPTTVRATIAEHGETLRPDLIVRNPEGVADAGKVRLLVQVYPPEQGLEKAVPGRHWKASPATRMMELLHATDVRLGLVTNGEHWMLVDAPKGETTGFASWYATLWFEEPLTLRAFRSLLGVGRFFSAADDETLEAMLKESASNQQEVTDRLGYQVREAVEEIVRALDRIDQGEGRQLLAGVSEGDLYEAALTVMMRLVFLFSAEERGLLLLGDPLFDEHYAVSTLVAKLQEAADQHGEGVLERRNDAWVRLLSTFRAVYGGVRHERLKLLPYAGRLFDPDRFPFLEGRKPGTTWKESAATPLPIDNRTVLHLLRSLQYLEMQGEARRLSFRALDIEQIGHVYEGLLDHTARRATEPMLSLKASKGDEPEVAVSELERLKAKGEADLLKFLKEETGRSENALRKDLGNPVEGEAVKRLRAACGNDDALFNRVRPFSGLVRADTFDRLVVIRPGSFFVTSGTDRRSSGTHYTPRSLTEPIVQYTLEPLVYVGPAEGKPKEEWTLRSAGDILDLKVCDMACGSGAFLVQACRYLSERLVEAWEDAEKRHPGVPGITPEGTASTGAAREQLIPKDTDERLAYARRLVTQRCLYGVDKNPLAAEMAKLSLWLLTLARDKPFTFLDHAIRCGDSLVGVSSETQLKTFSLDGQGIGITLPNFLDMIPKILEATRLLRIRLEKTADDTIADVEEKQRLFENIRFQTKRLNYAADRLMAVSWGPAKPAERVALSRKTLQEVDDRIRDVPPEILESQGIAEREEAGCPQPFHWALEFPEVFLDRGGFDAFIGNPPFLGGARISGNLGDSYVTALLSFFRQSNGYADLCSFFLRRASDLLRLGGTCGFITTNSISKGETRTSGLEFLIQSGNTIFRAVRSLQWPGTANVFISFVFLRKGAWGGQYVLDDRHADGISSFLDTQAGDFKPYRLPGNQGLVFRGPTVGGEGFILSVEEREDIIQRDPNSASIIKPFLTGIDINQSPAQSSNRFAIDFGDLDEQEAKEFQACWERLYGTVRIQRQGNKIPQREKYWWRYIGRQEKLYEAIAGFSRVLACGEVSKYWSVSWINPSQVFAGKVVVFALKEPGNYAVLNSVFHTEWAEKTASRLKGDPAYSLADTFETFARPRDVGALSPVSEALWSKRTDAMRALQAGLTSVLNMIHNPQESRSEIKILRDVQVLVDESVAKAYGWDDFELGHGFHETRQGTRFTISEPARREVLVRLLKLNHERYAEEVAQGLHDKKGKAKGAKGGRGRKGKSSSGGAGLNFGDDEDDPDQAPAPEPPPARERASSSPTGATARADRSVTAEAPPRPTPIDALDSDAVMAAFRQASRGRGRLERDELLKEVSLLLGYQRLGPRIDEALRGHLRAAIRRRIVEPDGPHAVRPGAATMADYDREELRECFRSVMRKGTRYDREDVIAALARHLGFVRLTDTIRQPIQSAITSAIRRGDLHSEGGSICRE